MSRLFGPRQSRGWTFEPPILPNSLAGGQTFARVDLSVTEASLQKVAVWACVNLVRTIAELLPLECFIGTGEDRRQVDLPRFLTDISGDGFGLADWGSQVLYSEMLRGNAVGSVLSRDNTGRPTQIMLHHPDQTSAYRDARSGKVEWRVNGQLQPTADIWHRRVNPVPGHLLGLSPIAMHVLTISSGIAAMRFGAQFFEDGAHPSGILTYDKDIDNTKAETAKQRFVTALRGKREPVVLGNGWKYQAIQIAPNESQFLELNNYTGAECCRIFGPALAEVFGYETGNSLTYANIEQRSLDLLTYAADPWLVRLEKYVTDLMSAQRYVEFNRKKLLKSDLLSRYQAHQIALRNRFMVPNEVREEEGMPPLPGGDQPLPISQSPQPVQGDSKL